MRYESQLLECPIGDVCARTRTYAHVRARMRTYAHICVRMLTYADARHSVSRMTLEEQEENHSHIRMRGRGASGSCEMQLLECQRWRMLTYYDVC